MLLLEHILRTIGHNDHWRRGGGKDESTVQYTRSGIGVQEISNRERKIKKPPQGSELRTENLDLRAGIALA